MTQLKQSRFGLGRVVATPGALSALEEAKEEAGALPYLTRHARCDWGEVCQADREENEESLKQGCRLLSAYTLKTLVKIWIITEADRSATTILLPEEY